MSRAGEEILQGMREALAFASGQAAPEAYAVVHLPPDIDVREIRCSLNMTQQGFASAFGFSVTAVRHWEQRRRRPKGAARAYLQVIARNPEAVRLALRAESK